jgi:diaminohydroxyphosphoribosylaminopyrimidine deaminase/5-amino-6-(5-phosphoribosylamino)uracil reductase
MALAEAGEAARGATLYVNLEPCAHQGRTPPCAEALVRHGVRRVVAALQDPNPLVDGQGFRQLREAGIRVEVGLLEEEARRLNETFLHGHLAGRPLVTLKAALSLDGMLAAASGESRWITGAPARRFGHRLRLRHDAVLVGAGTVRRDDPRLTVRLAAASRPRLRVVLAPELDIDPASRIFEREDVASPATRIYALSGAGVGREASFAGRAEVVRVAERNGSLDLAAVLADLMRCGVGSLMVEGGGRTLAHFVDAGIADRAAFFVARKLIGARGGTALLERESVREPAAGWRLIRPRQLALGRDLLLVGDLMPGGSGATEGACSPG